MTVSLVCDGPGSQTPGMELAGETAGILLRLAAEAGVQAEQHVCRDPEAETPLGQMRRTLLAGPLERISGLEPWARAVRLESVRQECVFGGGRSSAAGQGRGAIPGHGIGLRRFSPV